MGVLSFAPRAEQKGAHAQDLPFALRTSLEKTEFRAIQKFIFEIAGIHLGESKQALVIGRLAKRLKAHGLENYSDYIRLISEDAHEAQMAVDLLTTNETYFFREPPHFAYLRDAILPARPANQKFRVWSAACSSGEEPYSIAMLLAAEAAGVDWEITATDLSTRVLDAARKGRYGMSRIEHIPKAYLSAFCLKGTGPEEGNLLVEKGIRRRVKFMQANLNAKLPDIGMFDLIWLRNVMIYFQEETKRALLNQLIGHLNPGGHLFIGHSESLNGISDGLVQVKPAIFRRPE